MSGTLITIISSVIVVLALTAIMVVVTILYYKRRMQRKLDAHSTPAPVYEVVAPLQTPNDVVVMEMEENACYAQNIVPKDNVAYEKTRAEQVQEEGEYY